MPLHSCQSDCASLFYNVRYASTCLLCVWIVDTDDDDHVETRVVGVASGGARHEGATVAGVATGKVESCVGLFGCVQIKN